MPPLCEYCEAAVDWHMEHASAEGQRIDLPFHDSIAAFLESGKQCQLCALILQEDQCSKPEDAPFKSFFESNDKHVGFEFSMLKAANGFSRFWPTYIKNDDISKESLNVIPHHTEGWMTCSQANDLPQAVTASIHYTSVGMKASTALNLLNQKFLHYDCSLFDILIDVSLVMRNASNITNRVLTRTATLGSGTLETMWMAALKV